MYRYILDKIQQLENERLELDYVYCGGNFLDIDEVFNDYEIIRKRLLRLELFLRNFT